MSFAEMAQRRERMGKKAFLESLAEQRARHGRKQPEKRKNKHAPIEVSAKKPVSRMRDVVSVPTKIRRDPRFDNLSGHLNEDLFQKSYSFLDDIRARELKEMQQTVATTKDFGERRELKDALQAMQNRERAKRELEAQQRIKREWRKQEAAKLKTGEKSKPFFLKESERKKLAMVDKLRGKTDKELDRVIERKRKRDAGKEWKFVPKRRRMD
ncbi:hypothetical protein BC828DRAFT_384233 [Blastocladiella britannica]|nr:hypothetical protein BC828DRAFT_384233 [Blastocladiella britannica]